MCQSKSPFPWDLLGQVSQDRGIFVSLKELTSAQSRAELLKVNASEENQGNQPASPNSRRTPLVLTNDVEAKPILF